jgi:hypothetical protein
MLNTSILIMDVLFVIHLRRLQIKHRPLMVLNVFLNIPIFCLILTGFVSGHYSHINRIYQNSILLLLKAYNIQRVFYSNKIYLIELLEEYTT